jgi:hypothetical protein
MGRKTKITTYFCDIWAHTVAMETIYIIYCYTALLSNMFFIEAALQDFLRNKNKGQFYSIFHQFYNKILITVVKCNPYASGTSVTCN